MDFQHLAFPPESDIVSLLRWHRLRSLTSSCVTVYPGPGVQDAALPIQENSWAGPQAEVPSAAAHCPVFPGTRTLGLCKRVTSVEALGTLPGTELHCRGGGLFGLGVQPPPAGAGVVTP